MGGLVSDVGFGLHSLIALSKINSAESFPLAPVSLMERKLHSVMLSLSLSLVSGTVMMMKHPTDAVVLLENKR